MEQPASNRVSRTQLAIAVLWPSFVTAIACSGVFFSAFRPRDLVPFNLDLDLSPLAIYSIGFLLFWLFAALSSFGTFYFTLANSPVAGSQSD